MAKHNTVIGEYCYIIQDICKHKMCVQCDELKHPDKDGDGNL